MKIKDCIKNGCETFTSGKITALPITLAEFMRNMAILLVIDADQRLHLDYPDITIAGEKRSGKAIEETTIPDILHVLKGDDLMRSTSQFTQFHGFIKWYLEQEADENEEDEKMWWFVESIAEKWNEYAGMKKA